MSVTSPGSVRLARIHHQDMWLDMATGSAKRLGAQTVVRKILSD
jgi:hypothetical protein